MSSGSAPPAISRAASSAIASASPRSPADSDQDEAVVGLDEPGVRLEEVAVEVDQGRAAAVGAVVLELDLLVDPELLAELGDEAGARGQGECGPRS